MKLQFKHQKFQEDAARAVCDVFTGQPLASRSYVVDPGKSADGQGTLINIEGFANEPLVNSLTPEVMLSRITKMQRDQQHGRDDDPDQHLFLLLCHGNASKLIGLTRNHR